MGEHFKSYSSVLPIILKDNKVLLHLRKATGYMDGYWDLAGSGHVEQEETATEALIREIKEEIDVEVKKEELEFAYLFHNVGLDGVPTYSHIYFWVKSFTGEPHIMEPEKNAGLGWYDIHQLPEQIIPLRKQVLLAALDGEKYGEQKS